MSYLDYKTCPKCYKVIHKVEFAEHNCKNESPKHPVDVTKAEKEELQRLKDLEIAKNQKYNSKEIDEIRTIAKEMGIVIGTKPKKQLISEILTKESEVK
jgi:hypothetical protein